MGQVDLRKTKSEDMEGFGYGGLMMLGPEKKQYSRALAGVGAHLGKL